MNKLITLTLLVFATLAAAAQSYDPLHDTPSPKEPPQANQQSSDTLFNFHVKNGDLVWQKVFETNLSFDQIQDAISSMAGIYIQSVTPDERIIIKGEADKVFLKNQYNIPYSEISYSVQFKITYSAFVDFKGGKYRVTVTQINTITPIDVKYGLGNSWLIELAYNAKKSSFRKSFIDSGKPLDLYFSDVFSFKEIAAAKDDW